MEEIRVIGNMNDILSTMDHLNGKNVYPVYIPSLKRNVMFKEMTTGQEKTIVKTIIDDPIYNSGFIFAIRDIIKQNCAEDLNVDNLTAIDKTAICLTMRQKSIGDSFDYIFKGTSKKKTINISEYIDKVNTLGAIDNKVVGNDRIKVVCKYPTILDEYTLEMEFRDNTINKKVQDDREAVDINTEIGNVFINEVVKYIKEITLHSDESDMVLDMSQFTFKNRIAIVEKIGSTVLAEILKYIEETNKEINKALTIELQLSETEQLEFGKQTLTGMLGAGSNFFIIS